MNRYKWMQWIVILSAIALIAAGCSNKEKPAIDPPQYDYENSADDLAQMVGLFDTSLEEKATVSVFLKDPQHYIVPISMEVPYEEGIAKLVLQYMTVNGPYAHLLPPGFTPILPEGTVVNGMNIDEHVAIIDFSSHFNNYKAEDERKILEAVTWALTEFPTIKEVKIWVDGKLLKEMPVAGIPLDEPLSRAMGINIEQGEGVRISQSTPVTLYFVNQTADDQTYFVPVTRLIEQTDHRARAAMEQLVKGPSTPSHLLSAVPADTQILDVQQFDDLISLFVSDDLFQMHNRAATESLHALVLSLTENSDATKVKITVNNHTEVISMDDVNYSTPVFRPTPLNKIGM